MNFVWKSKGKWILQSSRNPVWTISYAH